jgi:hypothetical protein
LHANRTQDERASAASSTVAVASQFARRRQVCGLWPRQLRRGRRDTRNATQAAPALWNEHERMQKEAGTGSGQAVSTFPPDRKMCCWAIRRKGTGYPEGRKLCGLRSFPFTGTGALHTHSLHVSTGAQLQRIGGLFRTSGPGPTNLNFQYNGSKTRTSRLLRTPTRDTSHGTKALLVWTV